MSDWIAAGLVWGSVLVSFYRGYRKGQRLDRFVLLTWAIFLCIAGVFTLRIPAIETMVDGLVSGHPIAYFLNAEFTLAAALLYAICLAMFRDESRSSLPSRPNYRKWIYTAFGVAILLGVLLLCSLSAFLPKTQARLLMRFVLSIYLLALFGGLLLPFNWWMFHCEQVFPMRCKHLASIIGLGIYALGAALAVLLIPLHLLTNQVPPDYAANMRGVLGGLCILVILAPHRWIVMVLLPQKLHMYYRIARVEHWITTRVAAPCDTFDWHQAISPLYVDHITYLAVINIMDHYRELAPPDVQGQAVASQIKTIWPENPRYDDLVKALSRVAL